MTHTLSSALKKVMQTIYRKIADLNIFQKLIIAFIFIILFPTSILYYFSLATTREIIIKQVCGDTLHSLQLVTGSVNYELKKMVSVALYVNQDDNIKEIINHDLKSNDVELLSTGKLNLQRLERIDKLNNILKNIAFTTMGTKCYMTLITKNGEKITNWPYEEDNKNGYFNNSTLNELNQKGNQLVWKSLERNYVSSDSQFDPYVITLTTAITDAWWKKKYGLFLISVPTSEFNRLLSAVNPLQQQVMLDQNGLIIASSNKQWLNRPFKSICAAEIPDDAKGYFVYKSKNKEKFIITYSEISTMNWTIVNIRSYASLTVELSKTTNRLLLINLVCLLIFLGISSIIAQSITAPLKNLTKKMLHLNLNEPIKETIPQRQDEVGILERSFNIMRGNIQNLIEENKLKEQRKKEAELKALQAQVSPHFLFNTLNAIRWAALNKNNQKAATMVLSLSKLLKMTIVKGDELIPLELEIDNLNSYAEIFRLRHTTQFELICEIDEIIKQYPIPKLLLQPLVENAIIHGFDLLKTGGKIKISGFKKDQKVLIRIEDNGKGMNNKLNPGEGETEAKGLKFSGMGISNVDERIKLYYGEEYGLTIESQAGLGTTIEISLPDHFKEGI